MAKRIVLASGKGGVGKSTVTVGLCRAFTSQGLRVLVIDADIGLRSLDMMFGVQDEVVFDWGDYLEERCTLRQAMVTMEHGTLLAAPLQLSPAFEKERLCAMMDSIDADFDCVLIDAPAGIGAGFRVAAAMADHALLVALPDVLCVRSCEVAAQSLAALGIEGQRLIINRFDENAVRRKKQPNIDEVIDGCGVQLIGIVPEDREILYNGAAGQEPGKRSAAKKAFLRIAKRLLGEDVALTL